MKRANSQSFGEVDMPEKRLLTDEIYQVLRAQLLHGDIAPGVQLVEYDIARRMRVSQGSVREALQRLRLEGLVISHPHRGTFAADVTVPEALEVYHVRAVVEGRAVRRATARLTPEDLAVLRSIVADMASAAANEDQRAVTELDMRFHEVVCTRAESPFLLEMWRLIDLRTRRFTAITNKLFFNSLAELIPYHEVLVDALASGDADRAERAFKDHMSAVWTWLGQSGDPMHDVDASAADDPASGAARDGRLPVLSQ